MGEQLSLTVIDCIKGRVHAFVAAYRKRLKGCRYIDVRVEVSETKGGYAQNGTAKDSYEDAELSMGIRVHAGEGMIALGYFGHLLGSTDVRPLEVVLGDGIDHAYRRAWANLDLPASRLPRAAQGGRRWLIGCQRS
jgi:TldD protein